jgi:YggT family protein
MDYSFGDFSPVSLLIGSILSFLKIYFAIIITRILLTWFPNIDWMQQIVGFISPIVDPYLNLFRFIPPIGMIDISSIVAIFALQILIDNLTPFAPRLLF